MRQTHKILLVTLLAITAMAGTAAKHIVRPVPPYPIYSIMIYMNGSDLESDFGAATDDLAEMLDSGLDSRYANVLILTGGANHWQNNAIPDTECIIWQLADGKLHYKKSLGQRNMGNPDTLRDFITYCTDNHPAPKTGLIMWDHGGGAIAGFGHDENFGDSALTLADMQSAFTQAGLRENKLEFLGFDACLMATVEMAILAQNYAHVLIASEDLEPGEGWDYTFLRVLNRDPHICGFSLGKIIVDTFMDYYIRNNLAHQEILTLSVADLSKVTPVMHQLGELSARLPINDNTAARRAATKTFGEGSPRDNYADMVDIGDMAHQLHDLFPDETEKLLAALKNCVTYNRHNSATPIYGLSAFYIYGGKSIGEYSLNTYSALNLDENYTDFLHRFFRHLQNRSHPAIRSQPVFLQPTAENTYNIITAMPNNLAPAINGEFIALFPIARTQNCTRYVTPAIVNGRDADIIIIFNDQNPDGKILGIRYNAHNVYAKGCADISPYDQITLLHLRYDTHSERLVEGNTHTGGLTLTLQPPPPDFINSYRHMDACCNYFYKTP